MKNLWVALLIAWLGCASAGKDENGEELLKSGEVAQLAFTTDGKNLVVVNEFRHFADSPREKSHSGLRSFSTSDWKIRGDSGELSLLNLRLASSGPHWIMGAMDFDRFGRGNPRNGSVCYELDPVTMERKSLDVIQKGPRNREYSVDILGCAPKESLTVVYMGPFPAAAGSPLPPFLFDVKAGKKTIDLQDWPTGKGFPGDFAGPALAFSPDGKQIVSFPVAAPYQMHLHDAANGKLLKSMKVESPVGALKISPNGQMLAALCQDGTLLILHPDLSGSVISKRLPSFTFQKSGSYRIPHAIAFVNDEYLVAISGDTAELFDTEEWKSVRAFDGPKHWVLTSQGKSGPVKGRVNCVAGSPEGKLLAAGYGQTGFFPGKVCVFEVETGKLVAEFD